MAKLSDLGRLPPLTRGMTEGLIEGVCATPLVKTSKEGFEAMYEEKPKRVKFEYVKVEEPIFDVMEDYYSGRLFGDSLGEIKITTFAHLGACFDTGKAYRRVETEISERDEFIATAFNLDAEDVSAKAIGLVINPTSVELVGKMFDSGKFKLVEGK